MALSLAMMEAKVIYLDSNSMESFGSLHLKKRDFLADSASGNAEHMLLTEVLGGSLPFLCNWTRPLC